MERKDKILKNLNDLYNLNIRAENRFRGVAQNMYDPELKRVCYDNAMQRNDFRDELATAILLYKGVPEEYISNDVSAHVIWSDFKFLAGGLSSVEQFYEELEYYTKISFEAYQEVINDISTPAEITEILRRHWTALVSKSRILKNLALAVA